MQQIPIDLIHPNKDQPRQHFDEEHIWSLAMSIRESGLMQPIRIRPLGDFGYLIVAGECRWRAHKLLVDELGDERFMTIAAIVQEMDEATMHIEAIIENLQRRDVSPLEEARAYQRLLDRSGMSVEQLKQKLGIAKRGGITDRLSLLNLRPEYQDLLNCGQLRRNDAYHMSRLSPHGQDELFARIKRGEGDGYGARMRELADAILDRENQTAMFDLPPEPTPEERAKIDKLERRIENLCRLLGQGFDDGEVVIAKKVDPNKASLFADKLKLIGRHVEMLERQLRQAAVMLDAAA